MYDHRYSLSLTTWKLSVFGVVRIFSHSDWIRQNTDQKNSEYGYLSRSVWCRYNIFASWGLYKNHKKQHFLWSILSDLRRGIARIPQISKIESFVTIAKRLKVVNYCCKTLHLRCLQGFLATPLLRLTARINRSEWVSCCQYANRNILTK